MPVRWWRGRDAVGRWLRALSIAASSIKNPALPTCNAMPCACAHRHTSCARMRKRLAASSTGTKVCRRRVWWITALSPGQLGCWFICMLLHPFVDCLPVTPPLQDAAKAGPRERTSATQPYQPRKRDSIVISDITDSHDFRHVRDATHGVDVDNTLVVKVPSGVGHTLPPLCINCRWAMGMITI